MKSRGIGNSCTMALPAVDGAILLARCFRDSPPRWTDRVGDTHVLRAHRDRSGTQLAAGRALGVLYRKIEERMAAVAVDVAVTLRAEPIRMALCARDGEICVLVLKAVVLEDSP